MTDPKELPERSQYLFKCLIERYITDGHPVGSRTLARDANLNLSPATIRNVMADLEDLGLISSPHTSAGRVPTVKGYRLFIDSMLTLRDLPHEDVARISNNLTQGDDLQSLLVKTSNILSDITRFAGLVMVPRADHRSLRQVEFLALDDNRVLVIIVLTNKEIHNRIIHTARVYTQDELHQAANYLNLALAGKSLQAVREDLLNEMSAAREEMNRMMQAVIEMSAALVSENREDDFVLAGETNLMDIGELSDIEKLRQLFEAFNRKRDILHLLEQALSGQGIQIFIGEESGYSVLDACSIVTSTYEFDGEVLGVLGVIGPTRMAYERVIPIVDLTAKILGSTLKTLN